MEKYNTTTKVLHWLMAVMIIGLICVGLFMASLDKEDPTRPMLIMMHKSTGLLVMILAVVRLSYSLKRAVELPDCIQGWQRVLAKSVKHSLYLLMLMVPVSGFLMSNAIGSNIAFYNLFEIPAFMEKNRTVFGVFHEAHEILAFLLIGFIVLHIAGAIKHRISKNPEEDVLNRML